MSLSITISYDITYWDGIGKETVTYTFEEFLSKYRNREDLY